MRKSKTLNQTSKAIRGLVTWHHQRQAHGKYTDAHLRSIYNKKKWKNGWKLGLKMQMMHQKQKNNNKPEKSSKRKAETDRVSDSRYVHTRL